LKSKTRKEFPILKTKRLTLDRLKKSDYLEVFSYLSNAANFPYVDMPQYKTHEEVYEYINKMDKGINEGLWILWAIRLDGVAIGSISLWNFNHKKNIAETGYGLFSHRGNGYMQEALKAVLEYGFDTIKLARIEAFTNKVNIPSRNLLSKCGFTYDSEITEKTSLGNEMELIIYKNEGNYGK